MSFFRLLSALLMAIFGFLAFFSLFFYKLFILFLCIFVILWLHFIFRFKKYTLALLISVSILFSGFIAIPDFNFWLTYSTRQRLVNDITSTDIGNREFSNLFLGKVNSYGKQDQIEVYFTYYKGIRGFSDRAFFVYTTNPERTEKSESGGIKNLERTKRRLVLPVNGSRS